MMSGPHSTVDIVFSFSTATQFRMECYRLRTEANTIAACDTTSAVLSTWIHDQCERLDIPGAFDRVLEAA